MSVEIAKAIAMIQKHANRMRVECECAAQNPDGMAQLESLVSVVKQEVANIWRDLLPVLAYTGLTHLTEIDEDRADTMRSGIDLVYDNCPPEQWVSCLICAHPDVIDGNEPISAVRVTVYGLYVRQGEKDLFFQMEPLAVK